MIAATVLSAANDSAAPIGNFGASNVSGHVFSEANDGHGDGARRARLLHDLDSFFGGLLPRPCSFDRGYNFDGDVIVANGVASMIAFFQLLIANKGARRTRAEVASVRLLTRMMAVGEIAARLDAARRSGGSRFVAARKCDDGEAAMALQIFGH